jgi:hypothetical protein
MTRRILSFFCILALLASCFLFPAHASEHQETVVYYEDGSYLVTTIAESYSRSSGTKTGSKEDRYYDASGNLQWKITVSGTFSYNGITSNCIYADGTTTIVDSSYARLGSESTYRNGATATYTIKLEKIVLGIVVGKETHSISLTCDKDGNLS